MVAVWRPRHSDVVLADGIGLAVARQFSADLAHVAEDEAITAPRRRITFLRTPEVQVPPLEARQLIEGVEAEPAFATLGHLRGAEGLCVHRHHVGGPRYRAFGACLRNGRQHLGGRAAHLGQCSVPTPPCLRGGQRVVDGPQESSEIRATS